MKKEKFCPTCNEEAKIHIWIAFCLGQVIVETNKKATYDRLLKKLGEPNKKQYEIFLVFKKQERVRIQRIQK